MLRRFNRILLLILFVCCISLCVAGPIYAQSTFDITLGWDSNHEPDLGGYKLHYGISQGGPYTETIDVGNVTQYIIEGLPYGTMHYFVATAYDTEGLESGYSNEVFADGATNVEPLPPDNFGVTQIIIHHQGGMTVTINIP